MRSEGISLVVIGASSILAAPWALKFLWAPLVDHFSGSPLGARRGWILPLQALTIVVAVALGFAHELVAGASAVWSMAIGLFVMNALAATQDIGTDGLAVDILDDEERGHGNGVQVAAYRLGMVVGGGGLVKVFAHFGWTATFIAMALILALVTVPIALFEEPRHPSRAAVESRAQWDAAIAFLRRRGVLFWIAIVMIYKLGDSLPGPTRTTLLVDGGYSMDQIGNLIGIGGSIAGFVGAMTGGALAAKTRLYALMFGGVFHTFLLSAYAIPAFTHTGADFVAVLVVAEHFTGGIATVALFTVMMDVCDPKAGGTEYTVQASAVVFVQFIGSLLSGVSAQVLGYGLHFVVVGVVSAIGVAAMALGFAKMPKFERGDEESRD
jgi:predicted MFS family arabinose efflux permease